MYLGEVFVETFLSSFLNPEETSFFHCINYPAADVTEIHLYYIQRCRDILWLRFAFHLYSIRLKTCQSKFNEFQHNINLHENKQNLKQFKIDS